MEFGAKGDLFRMLGRLHAMVISDSRRSSSLTLSPPPFLHRGGGGGGAGAGSIGGGSSLGAGGKSAAASGRRKKPGVDLREAFDPLQIALGIANGMKYLHSHGMVHCDLKAKMSCKATRNAHGCNAQGCKAARLLQLQIKLDPISCIYLTVPRKMRCSGVLPLSFFPQRPNNRPPFPPPFPPLVSERGA